jgi:hypothetical protein
MEHDGNTSARAPTDERACPSPRAAGDLGAQPRDAPQFATGAEADTWRAGVAHGLLCATGENRRDDDQPPAPRGPREEEAEILDPSGRRLRVDGWLPWKKARFLLVLIAGGIVADACRAVGMSVTSAYALKNRRSGRAFGRMWDAILIHRARGRLADNNLSRAMNGCVEQVLKDGVVIAERRRFDNRLSMAMLTRLDRLAESKSGEEAELLRALSEDFEDYLEVVEGGGDEDAFVEARRPRPEEAAANDRPAPWYKKDFLDDVAAAAETSPWRHVAPTQIPIGDLDPDRMDDWGLDGWIRAVRSYYLDWLELYRDSGRTRPDGPGCPAAYDRIRGEIWAAMAADGEEEEEEEEEESGLLDSSPGSPGECSGRPSPGRPADCRGQAAPEPDPAQHGGGVPFESEKPLHPPSAGPPPRPMPERNDSRWQASTSSTSPPPPDSAGGGES